MSRPTIFFAALCAAFLLALSGCQTADPPEPEIFIQVRLNESMAEYENVLVQIFDRKDTSKALDTLWEGRMTDPRTQIGEYNATPLNTQEFAIKVTGYKARQLALQTWIYYSDGVKTVRYVNLPPLLPQNWLESLKPSIGKLDPAFNRDSLRYFLNLPQGATSVSFTLTAAYSGASIMAESEKVAQGGTTKPFQVGNTPDTVLFTVTDTSTGTASTRNYSVTLIPTPPPELYLASLVPSTGTFNHEFTPSTAVYVLYMPADKDTVTFRAAPVDPGSMTVTIDGQAVFAGQQSQIITVPKGEIRIVDIYVYRGGEFGVYHLVVDHVQNS